MNRDSMIASAAFAAVGLLLLAFAALQVKSELDFRAEAVAVDGTVVEETGRKSPIVEYVDRAGATYRVTGDVGGGSRAPIGSVVRVFYRSEDPTNAHIDNFMQSWLFPLLLGAMGLLFGASGAAVFTQSRRHRTG